ncbi:MAG: hypothetical protein BMS9Abin08_1387 [Gammaproteobacteria bacterium]|nr:MAG: hypothetical protein BMS9Abin08_1387 [Gammaproteobacteria bacterium]
MRIIQILKDGSTGLNRCIPPLNSGPGLIRIVFIDKAARRLIGRALFLQQLTLNNPFNRLTGALPRTDFFHGLDYLE